MLEVLDPEQNHNFEDHYLDFPYDLSQVMWITTANSLYSIPSALEDRMEVIEFPGYVEEEKIHIARQFLVPRQMEQNGLSGKPLAFGDDALKRIIREYTYEAGVRELDRKIAQVCRKIARRRAENAPTPARIVSGSLDKFLGPPHSDITRIEKEDQIGVVNGVSWTQAGGDLLPIEVILMEGNGNLTLTGQLGDVMQESAKTAFSYVRMMAQKEGAFKASYFEKTNIHIHAPEGAVPKDGPSAGIALATAIVSALSKTPVRRDVEMTGETTLRGRVLPIGSLREKLLAAHRAGIKTFIMPEKNRKDLAEVPRNVLRDVKVICVSEMEEVLKHALSEPLPLAPPEKTSPKPRKPPAKKKPVKKPVRKPVANKK
jgi:ATP-dependent Lon protease